MEKSVYIYCLTRPKIKLPFQKEKNICDEQ